MLRGMEKTSESWVTNQKAKRALWRLSIRKGLPLRIKRNILGIKAKERKRNGW